jgi:hypothetical protein
MSGEQLRRVVDDVLLPLLQPAREGASV